MIPDLQKVKNEGSALIKGLLSEKDVQQIKTEVSNLQPQIKIPFSDEPWGFGNQKDNQNISFFINKTLLDEVLAGFLGEDYFFNHILVNNKVGLIGPDVEWHQEIYNVDTYAPGCSLNNIADFLQVYVAIDEHTLENGCLWIVPKSTELGELEWIDIVNQNYSHKRRTKVDELRRIALLGYRPMPVLMDPGDVLIFDHLTLHGSASNVSSLGRASLVCQARSSRVRDVFEKKIFDKEVEQRQRFIVESLQLRIDKIEEEKKTKYNDFVRVK